MLTPSLVFRGIPIVPDPACDEDKAYVFAPEYESDVRRIVRRHRRKYPNSRVRVVTLNIGKENPEAP